MKTKQELDYSRVRERGLGGKYLAKTPPQDEELNKKLQEEFLNRKGK